MSFFAELFWCALSQGLFSKPSSAGFFTWFLSRGIFRCARLHGFFPSNVLQGDFNGNFRVSVSRSLFCRALFVRVFVGVDSMRFLEKLYLELFQGGFFRELFCGAPFPRTFSHERFPWALSRGLFPCAFLKLLFACNLSKGLFPMPCFAGLLLHAFCRLFLYAFSQGFYHVLPPGDMLHELFYMDDFHGLFSRGLFPRAFSSFAVAFCGHLFPGSCSVPFYRSGFFIFHSVAGSSFRAHFRRINFNALCCWELFGAPLLWGFLVRPFVAPFSLRSLEMFFPSILPQMSSVRFFAAAFHLRSL